MRWRQRLSRVESAHYRPAPPRPDPGRPAHLITSMAEPRTCLDTADAIELAEALQFIAGWLTTDPVTFALDLSCHTLRAARSLTVLAD